MKTIRPLALVALTSSLFSQTACPSDDQCSPGWSEVEPAGLDRVVLSAWERTPDDLWLVGGGLGVAGAKALILHGTPGHWSSIATDHDETLWWIWGTGDEIFAVGENGLILHRATADADFTVIPSSTNATLFGVWGSSPTDVWIVGGGPGNLPVDDDIVLHWNGSELTRDLTAPATSVALFKVWGSSADDLWVVGEKGTILHRTASAWTTLTDETLTKSNLLTVAGCAATDVFAVGGQSVLHYDGVSWSKATEPAILSSANGVSCGPGTILIVGNGGLKWRYDRATSTWIDEQSLVPWNTDFHGALVLSTGALLATGGNFNTPATSGPRKGIVGAFATCP